MFKLKLTLAFCLAGALTTPSFAQANYNQFTAGSGALGTINDPTLGNFNGPSAATGKQNAAVLPTTTSMPYAGTYLAPGNIALKVNHWGPELPVTNLDSFVYQAGGHAWDIYGDEGVYGPPPIDGFEEDNEIETGITGERAATITTGHYRGGDQMPSSWGWTMRP